jgi:hypothetical protein
MPGHAEQHNGDVWGSSKKQLTTASSTMEAKYQARGAVASEELPVRKALSELSMLCSDMPLTWALTVRCNNRLVIAQGSQGGAADETH